MWSLYGIAACNGMNPETWNKIEKSVQVEGTIKGEEYVISIVDADDDTRMGCSVTGEGKQEPGCQSADFFFINGKIFMLGNKQLDDLLGKIGPYIPSWGMSVKDVASRLNAAFSIHNKLERLTLNTNVFERHVDILTDAQGLVWKHLPNLVATDDVDSLTSEEFEQVTEPLRRAVIMTLSALAFYKGQKSVAVREAALMKLAQISIGEDYVPIEKYDQCLRQIEKMNALYGKKNYDYFP